MSQAPTLVIIPDSGQYLVHFEGYERFEFPHYVEVDYGTKTVEEAVKAGGTFPMLHGTLFDVSTGKESEEDAAHPIIKLLKDGAEIESVKELSNWRDDSCDCLDVEIVIAGKTYGYSDWWLSRDGVKMYAKAEGGQKKALEELKEHILAFEEM